MNLNIKQINYRLIKEKNFTVALCKNDQIDNDILIYSTHNKGKSVVAGKFIKTLKSKMYKKMTVNNKKSYLCYE